ncbi:MAG: hypothetical protein OXN97_02270 [Bryobacterales bacterium]|nr:hypothetical protein [Bryobacterales bacterium]
MLPEVNPPVYAHNDGAPRHEAARRRRESLVNGEERAGVPWAGATGFVRLVTCLRVLTSPVSQSDAIGYVGDWLRFAHVSPINPGTEHLKLLQRNLETAGVGANLVTDAHISALAMEYQAEVHSNDSDFSRFPGLRWRSPLR